MKEIERIELNNSYKLVLLGLVLGFVIASSIKQNIFISAIFTAYIFFSIFWGYKLMYSKLNFNHKSPYHISVSSHSEYFFKNMTHKVLMEFIKFWICYLVGALGGGIYMQIKNSKIAYS